MNLPKVYFPYLCLYIIFFILVIFVFIYETQRQIIHKLSTRKNMEDYAVEVFKAQIDQRKAIIQSIKSEADGFWDLHPVIVPEVFCVNSVRIGRVQDGGKWVCNVRRVITAYNSSESSGEECVIYSLGLNNEISFEQHLNNLTEGRCKFRMVDNKLQDSPVMEQIKQFNTSLLITTIARNTAENQTINFNDLLKHFGDQRVEMLKIDIEGAESEIVDQFLQYHACQLFIELHQQKPYDHLQMLQKISRAGYLLFASEANPTSVSVREYSWIHEGCLAKYGVQDTVLGRYLT